MFRKAHFPVLLTLLFSVAACSSGEIHHRSGPPALREVTKLPPDCTGSGSVPTTGQVTFIKLGLQLYGVRPDGKEAICIAHVDQQDPFFWGPKADRFAVARFQAPEIYAGGKFRTVKGPDDDARLQGFSRPAGDDLLFISSDGSQLTTVPISGGPPADISFLRRHDEVAVHPSGTQLAVIGEPAGDDYGIFLATDAGTDPQRVVKSGREDEFYGMAYSSDGSTLYYVIDLHNSWELHALDLTELSDDDALPKSTKITGSSSPISPFVSPFEPGLIAYREGDCDAGFETYINDNGGESQVDSRLDSQPIGWLPDGDLVIGESDNLCDPFPRMDLYIVSAGKEQLLVRDVQQAAIRAELPSAPPPASGPTGDGGH